MQPTMQERLAKKRAEREAAEALLSKADLQEIADREALRRDDVAIKEAEEKKRLLGLDRRVEEAQALHGAGVKGVVPEGCGHTFVVKNPGTDAYKKWENGVNADIMATAMKQRAAVSIDNVRTEFAVSAVVDWNGMTDFSQATENGHLLITFLTANPAIRTEIVTAAIELAKAAAEERKS